MFVPQSVKDVNNRIMEIESALSELANGAAPAAEGSFVETLSDIVPSYAARPDAAVQPNDGTHLPLVLQHGATVGVPPMPVAPGLVKRPLSSGMDDEKLQITDLIRDAALRYGIDANLLIALATAESNLNPRAISAKGAGGVMQLMPGTAASLGVTNLFDAAQNVDGGTRYFSKLLARFKDPASAIAAYNAGPGAVERFRGVPPYPETMAFVQRVLSLWRQSNGSPSVVGGPPARVPSDEPQIKGVEGRAQVEAPSSGGDRSNLTLHRVLENLRNSFGSFLLGGARDGSPISPGPADSVLPLPSAPEVPGNSGDTVRQRPAADISAGQTQTVVAPASNTQTSQWAPGDEREREQARFEFAVRESRVPSGPDGHPFHVVGRETVTEGQPAVVVEKDAGALWNAVSVRSAQLMRRTADEMVFTAELRLAGEEGKVSLTVTGRGSLVSIALHVDGAALGEKLQQSLPLLRQALDANGLSLADFTVTQQGGGQAGEHARRRQDLAAPVAGTEPITRRPEGIRLKGTHVAAEEPHALNTFA